jgi:hypothetical protein
MSALNALFAHIQPRSSNVEVIGSSIISAIEKPDHRYRRLLRARRERPCRRASEQRDEVAPPHGSSSQAKDSPTRPAHRKSARIASKNTLLLSSRSQLKLGFEPQQSSVPRLDLF